MAGVSFLLETHKTRSLEPNTRKASRIFLFQDLRLSQTDGFTSGQEWREPDSQGNDKQ